MSEFDTNPLGFILTEGTKFVQELLPGWAPPDICHPYLREYNLLELFAHIRAGDQIMVQAISGHWHHGLFVGEQLVRGKRLQAVVDVWGPNQEPSTISIRSYETFMANGHGFGKAKYPQGEALPHEDSKKLALMLAETATRHKLSYNAATQNCEHVVTLCRIGMGEGVQGRIKF